MAKEPDEIVIQDSINLTWETPGGNVHGFFYDKDLPQLDVEFLVAMQELGEAGQEKHKQPWQNKDYLNARNCDLHATEHLISYRQGEPSDHLTKDPKAHLVSVAFNAMMEWWYQKELEKENS